MESPLKEQTTGAPRYSARSTSSFVAPDITTPPPMRITGLWAERSSSAALATDSGSGRTLPDIMWRAKSGSSSSTFSTWMSIGRSMRTGPGLPLTAVLTASTMTLGSCLPVVTCQDPFTRWFIEFQ